MKREILIKNYIIILFSGITIVFLGFLGYRYLAPFGKIVHYRFTSKLPGAQEVTTFSPGKDSILRIPAQIITTSKSKLQLNLTSPDIESVKATLKFKPTVNEIIIGVRGNEKDNFIYRPLYRDLLYYLEWKKVEENGFTLWQKEKKFQTIYDFVNNPPVGKKTAAYYVDVAKLLLLTSTGVEKGKDVIIDVPLRGNHSFLVRVDKKPLILKVAKQDENGYEGEDKYKISVLKGKNILAEEIIEDDGIIDTSRLEANPQEKSVTLDIEPDVYQVNLDYEGIGADSFISKIEVNQPKVVFRNSIFILGNKPTTIWTNITNLNIFTVHDVGFQTVKLNDKKELKIDKRDNAFSFNLESLVGEKNEDELYKLESPKNDLIIRGDGYFAFSEDSFFFPEILKSIDLNTLSNMEDLETMDYVLTTYLPSKKEGDWLIAEVSFDPKKIKIEGDKLYFSLEVPQIAKYGGELQIDYLEIEVKYKGILEGKIKEEKKVTPTGVKAAASPAPSPVLTSSPTSTPSGLAFKKDLLIRILNGGAGKGAAAEFAEILKKAGFTTVEAGNADKDNYKNVLLQYRAAEKETAEKITDLLRPDYKTIDREVISTSSAEMVVILGEK